MNKKPFFENLDALRFFSFLVVFCFHVHLYDAVATLTQSPLILIPLRVLCSGGWGVTFFFVLSGFLITWLLLSEKEQMECINIKAFYLRRVLRIWPLYYLVIIVGFVVLPFLYKITQTPLLFDYPLGWYLPFLSNFSVLLSDDHINRSFPLVLHISWSVSIEEQFYLIWPLIFLFKNTKAKFILPASFLGISLIHAFIFKDNHQALYLSTVSRIGDLSIGGLFAATLYERSDLLLRLTHLKRRWIGVIYFLAFMLVSLSFYYTNPLLIYFINLAGGVVFALIICEQNFSKNSFMKFGKLKWVSYWGKRTYGLYMLHPIGMFVTSFILKIIIGNATAVSSGWWFMLLSFVLSLFIAWFSFSFFEKPFLLLKNRFEKLK
jgi:peptidoglycan/LPS O-acetylase OafA/YrhL